MPELPDIEAYLTGLRHRVVGKPLDKIRLASPFVLRSVDPPVAELEGKQTSWVFGALGSASSGSSRKASSS